MASKQIVKKKVIVIEEVIYEDNTGQIVLSKDGYSDIEVYHKLVELSQVLKDSPEITNQIN